MRIGVFLGETNPKVGGGFTFQDEVLRALIKQASQAPQHDLFVIGSSTDLQSYISALNPPSNLSFLFSKPPNLIERISEWLKRGFLILNRIIKYQGPVERLARKNRLDLIWYISGGCFEVLDTPYIATVWDLQYRLQPWFPEVSAGGIWAALETQYRYFLSRASFVIVGTEAGRQEVQLFFQIPDFRIYKLPHPTPSFVLNNGGADRVDVSAKYNIPSNYVFYPAQFWAHKNHINLLHAIKIIQSKYRLEVPLVLVGSDKGNAKFVLQTAKELGLEKQVHSLGFVPQSDLYDLYRNASLLAYVSLCGPENLPPLEAFAVECPVVASRVSGSEEQFGDAVLFCDPKDPEDIANKIYQLYSDGELRAALIEKGNQRAISWTPDDFVTGVIRIADQFVAVRRNWSS